MTDILADNNLRNTDRYTRNAHNYQSNNRDDCSESLQIINPQLTIYDLLNSMDSQPNNKTNQYCNMNTLASTRPNQQIKRLFSKEQNSGRQSDANSQCIRRQVNKKTNIQNVSTIDYHIKRTISKQQDDDEQYVLHLVEQNQQMQAMIEAILNQMNEQTQISEQLMKKTVTNNKILAQYKSMHYYYEQQIANIVPLLQQHTLKPYNHNIPNQPNSTNNFNKTTGNKSLLSMLYQAQNMGVEQSTNPMRRSVNPNLDSKTDSMNMSLSINADCYTLHYPSNNNNNNNSKDRRKSKMIQPDCSINSYPQLVSQLEEQQNATNHKNNDNTQIDKLFRNSIPLSAHVHQYEAKPKSTLYKKVVPNTSWNPEIPASNKNYIEQNKANLRRRLSQKPAAQLQPEKKQQKLQSKLSTPVKNEPIWMASGGKLQQNRDRRPIFNQSVKTSQQNSSRGRVSAVKIDVRAIK